MKDNSNILSIKKLRNGEAGHNEMDLTCWVDRRELISKINELTDAVNILNGIIKCNYCDDLIKVEDVIIDPNTRKRYHPNCARILMENEGKLT